MIRSISRIGFELSYALAHLARAGCPVKYIMRVINWTSVTSTRNYVPLAWYALQGGWSDDDVRGPVCVHASARIPARAGIALRGLLFDRDCARISGYTCDISFALFQYPPRGGLGVG